MVPSGRGFSAVCEATSQENWPVDSIRASEHARCTFARPDDVFAREYERLVRALTLIAGNREDAADAVQEAFVRLVSRWEQISAYEDPAGWVRRVALNRVRDRQRALWRQAGLLLRIQQEHRSLDDDPAWEASDQGLWHSLRTLPLRQRTVVALRYVADLTNREIAEMMHVSEGTVDRHLQRALQSLKVTLEENDE